MAAAEIYKYKKQVDDTTITLKPDVQKMSQAGSNAFPHKPPHPECKKTISTHLKKVFCARWNRDSVHICSVGQEGTVLVTNAQLGVVARPPIVSPFVMQCAMHADDALSSGRVACAGMNNIVEIWDIGTPRPEKKKAFAGHTGYISQIHFIENGTKLLTSSGDGSVIVWDLQKGCLAQTFVGHAKDVSGIAICDDNSPIFGTSSHDKTVRIWDRRAKYAERCFTTKYSGNCCAMMPEAKGIMVGCDNACYEFFSVESNQQLGRGKVTKGRCEAIAISSSGRFCFTGWDTGMIGVAESFDPGLNARDVVSDNDPACSTVASLSTAPDGSALLSAHFDKTIKVWGAGKAVA